MCHGPAHRQREVPNSEREGEMLEEGMDLTWGVAREGLAEADPRGEQVGWAEEQKERPAAGSGGVGL